MRHGQNAVNACVCVLCTGMTVVIVQDVWNFKEIYITNRDLSYRYICSSINAQYFPLITAAGARKTAIRQGQRFPWGGGLTCQRMEGIDREGVYISTPSGVMSPPSSRKNKKPFVSRRTLYEKTNSKRTNTIRIHPHPIFRKTEKTALGREKPDTQKRVRYCKTGCE